MKVSMIVVAVSLSLGSCSRMTDEELWLKVESAKANGQWDSTMTICRKIITEYPDSRYASWARFGIAESHRFLHQPREALDNYKIFYEQFPELQPSALSLFMVGYIYNNDLHMTDSAQYFYKMFLRAFPGHDLVPTVRFELETFGISPEQALEQRRKSSHRTRK